MSPLVILLLALTCVVSSAPNATIIKGNADQIMRCVLSDGSIAVSFAIFDLIPYWSHFAAFGLARASTFLSNKAYSEASWKWLLWAQNHQNPTTGFTTDYTRSGTTWLSTNTMDSTDSYAAWFILALYATYGADKNLTRLAAYQPGLARSVAAINATLNSGMTWALPSYQIKYLEDNAEVAAGLAACAELAKALGNPALQTTCQSMATLVRNTLLTSLKVSATGDYAAYLGAGSPDWTILYPDAESQMWPIAFGLLGGSSAVGLVGKFVQTHPKWASPLANDYVRSSNTKVLSRVGWGPVPCGWALLATGNTTLAAQASASIWAASVSSNYAWPYHVGAAGANIILELGKPFTIQPL